MTRHESTRHESTKTRKSTSRNFETDPKEFRDSVISLDPYVDAWPLLLIRHEGTGTQESTSRGIEPGSKGFRDFVCSWLNPVVVSWLPACRCA
jgi:hypothetical protein